MRKDLPASTKKYRAKYMIWRSQLMIPTCLQKLWEATKVNEAGKKQMNMTFSKMSTAMQSDSMSIRKSVTQRS